MSQGVQVLNQPDGAAISELSLYRLGSTNGLALAYVRRAEAQSGGDKKISGTSRPVVFRLAQPARGAHLFALP